MLTITADAARRRPSWTIHGALAAAGQTGRSRASARRSRAMLRKKWQPATMRVEVHAMGRRRSAIQAHREQSRADRRGTRPRLDRGAATPGSRTSHVAAAASAHGDALKEECAARRADSVRQTVAPDALRLHARSARDVAWGVVRWWSRERRELGRDGDACSGAGKPRRARSIDERAASGPRAADAAPERRWGACQVRFRARRRTRCARPIVQPRFRLVTATPRVPQQWLMPSDGAARRRRRAVAHAPQPASKPR